eukprot:TRINITY_DN1713_c0_g1_i3.p1 TRINITY_DN1713_c0_g1~~TRINITY_DN1713_c0_g1_i3.p1  ORF type:complete len:317 (+),score=84.01 TRINITY_DN1713_c0_g1_i3:195-1145(+)
MRQITRIIKFIHEKGVVHRDLKPENLLYSDPSLTQLKLCDFGLGDTIEDDELLTAVVGSTTYMAPEVARGEGYDKSVDLYSLGVILYILLCGYPPFEPEAGIVDLEFPEKEWGEISKSVIELIKKLLSSNPADRPTAEQLLRHQWIKGEAVSTRKLTGTIKSIKQYNVARKTGETMRKKDEVTKVTVFNLFDCPPEPTPTPVPSASHHVEPATSTLMASADLVQENTKEKKAKEKKGKKEKEKDSKKDRGRTSKKETNEEKGVSFGDENIPDGQAKKVYAGQIKNLQKELQEEQKRVKALELELKKKSKPEPSKKR